MDLQAHCSASPSKFIALKRRSPSSSPDRSESASLRLESGSVSSFTGSERTTTAVSSYRTEFRRSVQSLVDSVESVSMGHYLSTMDHQAVHLTSASKYAALKGRSPSPDRSESASLRLDSESVSSFTAGSERTISTVSSCYYSAHSESDLFLSQPSFIELAESDKADKYVPFQSEVIQRLISGPSTII